MSGTDGQNKDEGSWLDDLTPEERAWLENPGNERRGYQPKARHDDPQEPPPAPRGRASPSPRSSTEGNDSKPAG